MKKKLSIVIPSYKSSKKFLGHLNDMRLAYESCDLVVLPSWREGLSRSLIEDQMFPLTLKGLEEGMSFLTK